MSSIKMNKIGAIIKQDLYSIIKFGSILHPELEQYMFSIFAVKVSGDLSLAKCFISSYNEKQTSSLIKLLNKISPSIKHEFAKKVNLRRVPNFLFIDSKKAPQDLRYFDAGEI